MTVEFIHSACPGGFIVPAATAPGEVVLNGMSPSKEILYANSGMVVEVKEKDLIPFNQHGVLAGLYYQMSIEKMACEAGQNLQVAPAQRMADFVDNKISPKLNSTSYQPGIISTPLHKLSPHQYHIAYKKVLNYLTKK